ncbi:MAG: type I phosphomannose isomerase catalytic subunit [Bacteroidales bacterium]
MTSLYPLKFLPVLKERVWGGNSLAARYGKKADPDTSIGESWELSGLQGDISQVANGFLEGNNLEEIIEVYMGDLVGEDIFEKFGREFPLLIKLIDAADDLSIQVHPDDELARERHHAWGKTEMWYVLEAADNALIYTGFNREMNKESFIRSLKEGSIDKILNTEKPSPGDVFFLPPGRVHAIGKGVLLAEIQQASDITYRIWDWNRNGLDGTPREMHTELALNAIDYKSTDPFKKNVDPQRNNTVNLIDCSYFTTNIIEADQKMLKDFTLIDSFVVYMCTEGRAVLEWEEKKMNMLRGDTVLVPAIMNSMYINPDPAARLLEIYIRNKTKE